MTSFPVIEDASTDQDFACGREAARLIWDDDPAVAALVDPRTPSFAKGMIDASVEALRGNRGLIKRMIDRAAAGAEDLAVAQFQGIIEVIQNADDVRATEVRFALKESTQGRQLLIVHDGQPVTCLNVLGMALPYLTSKTERTDQRGRFGIGMKTLKRIAKAVAVHSAPYHFTSDQLKFDKIEAEVVIPGFYDPANNTMLVVDLNENFHEAALIEWFENWRDEGLLFLASVSRLTWCELDGQVRSARALTFSSWSEVDYSLPYSGAGKLQCRRVTGPNNRWTVWRATVDVPEHLHPAHKSRSEDTAISVALADVPGDQGIFIGFRTQVQSSLPFSLDAQFDPSTSREAIIENPWNTWLIEQATQVAGAIASGLLASKPVIAWSFIPLADEHVGGKGDEWIGKTFASAFDAARNWLGERAVVQLPQGKVPLSSLVYEEHVLANLLFEQDIEQMAGDVKALHRSVRDDSGRWRDVMQTLNESGAIGTGDLLCALEQGVFSHKPPAWWVEAGKVLVDHHPDVDLFQKPFLLSEDGEPVGCKEADSTARLLVLDASTSLFATRWDLLDRLHPAYKDGGTENEILLWLRSNAAFTTQLEPADELAAFAEKFNGGSIEISDEELRELRSRFDRVAEAKATSLGLAIGAILQLDGYVYSAGKMSKQKVLLSQSYLCKTLDGESSTWPDAAGTTGKIHWVSARYEKVLKTEAARWAKRKRDDGSVSRGARRFLMLLGAEISPRLVKLEGRRFGGDSRRLAELRERKADQVGHEYASPDLSVVLKDLLRVSKREARPRSPALLRTLSRNWERLYSKYLSVPAAYLAIKHTYPRGNVTAAWLNELREHAWVAVGRNEMATPQLTVLRTPETQATYQIFAHDLSGSDIDPGLAIALGFITDVRVNDLVKKLEHLREDNNASPAQTLAIYRAIAKRCPESASYNARVGEMTVQQLRQRFMAGNGLVHLGSPGWFRPDDLLMGTDIFHNRRDFVPKGSGCNALWTILGIEEPQWDDCIQVCRLIAQEPASASVVSALMDVYRYMERIAGALERRHKDKLRSLPLFCANGWVATRPVFYVEDTELRDQLAKTVPVLNYWGPPCDLAELPKLAAALGVQQLVATFKVPDPGEEATERGEQLSHRFGHAVEHLSAELARSLPSVREKLSTGWDQLKLIPLFVYRNAFAVEVSSPLLPASPVIVRLRAFGQESPAALHFADEDLGDREYGGKVISSFFPVTERRRIGAEWALAWQKGRDTSASEIRLASDDARSAAMLEAADSINEMPKTKILVTPPKSRTAVGEPRTLKSSVGAVLGAVIHVGSSGTKSKPVVNRNKGLSFTEPVQKQDGNSTPVAHAAYTTADLEQRGWEILVQALETSPDKRLVDFRRNHGVGADGVIDWKKFVEMKATARGPQTQVELSNNEFERAKQRGSEFILALVSGLESGQKDEVRLIFDPANCAQVRPTNGVRLVSLLEAPAVIIHFEGG